MWNTSRMKMTNIKGIIFVILITSLSFAGCKGKDKMESHNEATLKEIIDGETKVLLDDEVVEQVKKKVELTKVVRGDMSVEVTNKASFFYPIKQDIIFDETNIHGTIEEVYVNSGTILEKGDKIARISYNIESIKVEEMKLKKKRGEENYNSKKIELETSLKSIKRELDNAQTKEEKDKWTMEYEAKKIEIDNQLELLLEEYQRIKEETEEYISLLQDGYILAPVNGKIIELDKLAVGDVISPKHRIGIMEDYSQVYLAIDNEKGDFRYNMSVDIKVTNKGNTKDSPINYYKGIIISGGELLSWQTKPQKTYVKVLDVELSELEDKTIFVIGYTKSMKNVLLVDRTSVAFDKRTSYVLEEREDGVYKRNILIGGSDNFNYIVFDGLEEGVEVQLGINK